MTAAEDLDGRVLFDEARAAFDEASDKASAVSNSIGWGHIVEPRFGWATWIFARMGLTALSTTILLQAYVDERIHTGFDHLSIVSQCRSIVEQQIFLAYLVEVGISKDEWNLRKWTLDIHDCVSRIRLFRSLGNQEEKQAHEKELVFLRERLEASGLFQDLPREARSEILAGNRIYVRGSRTAAAAAGWMKDQWDGIYAYLSAPLHSAPLSFYRMQEHGVDNLSIAPYQLGVAGFSLNAASQAIRDATERMLVAFPEAAPT